MKQECAFKSDDGFDVGFGDGVIVIDKETLWPDFYEVTKDIINRRNDADLPMQLGIFF